jgi:hypothetical protein
MYVVFEGTYNNIFRHRSRAQDLVTILEDTQGLISVLQTTKDLKSRKARSAKI